VYKLSTKAKPSNKRINCQCRSTGINGRLGNEAYERYQVAAIKVKFSLLMGFSRFSFFFFGDFQEA